MTAELTPEQRQIFQTADRLIAALSPFHGGVPQPVHDAVELAERLGRAGRYLVEGARGGTIEVQIIDSEQETGVRSW